MALFGSSKRTFKPTPYGSTRKKRRVPRWLILMLTGIVLGSGGLLFIQKSYGPPVLTVQQADALRQELNSTNLEKQRLQSQVDRQSHEIDELRASLDKQNQKASTAEKSLNDLTSNIQVLVDAIPPDPRGTSPGIRAAEFTTNDGNLLYKLLVMQNKRDAATIKGKVDFAVQGRYPSGQTTTIELAAGNIEVGFYASLNGSAALPKAFIPVMVTIRIRDEADRLIATRTYRVR